MKPERWQRIEDLFHAVVARDPSERAAFLDGACGPDAELRAEIESLLRRDTEAGDFLESRGQNVMEAAFLPAQIGPYEVRSRLGAGEWARCGGPAMHVLIVSSRSRRRIRSSRNGLGAKLGRLRR